SIAAEKTFSRKDFEVLRVLDSVKCAYFVKYQQGFYELSGDMYLRPEIVKYDFSTKDNAYLGGRFVKNGNKVFNGNREVEVANLNHFKVFGESYYCFNGKHILYIEDYSTEVLKDADFTSFEVHPTV